LLLLIIGLVVGTVGTMIGAGGGFLLIPILLFLFPDESPDRIASLSMVAIAFNATSGSIAYLRANQVHVRAAAWFIAASLPGAVLGVWSQSFIVRSTFEFVFGIALTLYAGALLTLTRAKDSANAPHSRSRLKNSQYALGALLSLFVGFIASFLGIGGGIIHVPLLVHVLYFPVHLAAGTSHFILAVTAWIATFEHIHMGHLTLGEPTVLYLCTGVVFGAQIGARLSKRVPGHRLLRLLGAALALVGLRLLARAL
jgi:uncharacterized protein